MIPIKIKDLYAGKPDAKDEIEVGNIKNFVGSFIVPPNWDIDRLCSEPFYFVTGYKGTGKTALLRYIEDKIINRFPYTCSSFILFKEDFPEVKRFNLAETSKRMFNSISIDKQLFADGGDFQFIWRFFFLSKFLNDNEQNNNGLFVRDENWDLFKQKMNEIFSLNEFKLKWFSNVKFSMSFPSLFTVSGMVNSEEDQQKYQKIINLIEESDVLLQQLIRTDTPYYIFVDELEAYFSDETVFVRDLRLIRDLLFTIHKYNKVFQKQKSQTKIIGAVRQEILNAINQKIDSRELNKIISGFSQPLNWEYNNTTSLLHPIMQIFLKRILITCNAKGFPEQTLENVYEKWFPQKVHGKDPVSYILTNCWNKPRDIVRMLIAAQNSIECNASAFTQSVFDSFRKTYSLESLNEIKEELSALYSTQEIDEIFSCFNGFKISFSFQELQERLRILYPNSSLYPKLLTVLRDLFRIGVIGNVSTLSHDHRWYHRGNTDLQIVDDWNIYVHQALHSALSLTSQRDYHRSLKPIPGMIVDLEIAKIFSNKVTVVINYHEATFKGCVALTELSFSDVRINHLDEIVSVGDKKKGRILKYNHIYNSYDVSLKIQSD